MNSQPPAQDLTGFPVTKVYHHSAYRSSGTHSDHTWEIPGKETITTGPTTHVAFTDFQVGHSWYVVQTNVNDIFHIITRGSAPYKVNSPVLSRSTDCSG